MEIPDNEVRSRVLQIYAACRKSPEAPYDEDRFLDHLLEPPAKPGRINDSFAGTRRLVRFMDSVQADFAVYFSVKDWETRFSLSQFIERIQKLRQNPTGSLRSLENAKTTYDITIVIVANLIVVALALITRSIEWLFIVFVVTCIAMNCWVFWFYRREKKYLDGVEEKIIRLRDDKD